MIYRLLSNQSEIAFTAKWGSVPLCTAFSPGSAIIGADNCSVMEEHNLLIQRQRAQWQIRSSGHSRKQGAPDLRLESLRNPYNTP